MPLKSFLFKGNKRLEACLVEHSAHVIPGDSGPHVGDIQIAVMHLDQVEIAANERGSNSYGPSTAAAILAYKRKRNIINTSYQKTADNIVGKMTIAALDEEMFSQQVDANANFDRRCPRRGGSAPVAAPEPFVREGISKLALDGLRSRGIKPTELS